MANKFTLQYACVNRTLDPCKLIDDFIQVVDERTDGRVEIQLTSFPELGINGIDIISLIKDGTVGGGEIYNGYVAGEYPIFDIVHLWGLFDSTQKYFQAVDEISDEMSDFVKEKTGGGEVIAFGYYPSNYFFSELPFDESADFQGNRTRSHSTVLSDLLTELGALPQFIAFADVYDMLESGSLDAAVTCGSCGIDQRWYEVTKYLTGPIPGSFNWTFITFAAEEWESLPAELQLIIKEEGAALTAKNREDILAWDSGAINDLKAQGMIYSPFGDDIISAFSAAGQESVLPPWVARTGGPDSEAVLFYNKHIAPITGLLVAADGTIVKTG